MSSKVQRQHHIEQLLAKTAIGSQKQLRELMAQEGFQLSQVTISRDLAELGAIKIRTGGNQLYAIPDLSTQRSVPPDILRRVCSEWVVKVGCSQNIVVLSTPPGSAHVVASAIDRSDLDSVIGTVAGDDSIVVIADEAVGGADLAEMFANLVGIEVLNGKAHD